MKKLNEQEMTNQMTIIDPKWIVKGKSLYRELLFVDFVEAFSFMTSVALLAEKMSHHPSWKNEYNKVVIELNTHDADAITSKDFDLAKAIDTILK